VPTESPNTPLLIFDGDCGFCTTSAQWIEHRLPAPVHVKPWQRLDLGPLGLTEQDVTSAAYWVDERGRTYRGDAAIAKSLVAVGGVWKPIGWLLQVPPISLLAAVGYKLVAKYRYKLPGGTPACKVPQQ
jgi:predicted DCC family thiol-disulfide oxidoreductase YuxK